MEKDYGHWKKGQKKKQKSQISDINLKIVTWLQKMDWWMDR